MQLGGGVGVGVGIPVGIDVGGGVGVGVDVPAGVGVEVGGSTAGLQAPSLQSAKGEVQLMSRDSHLSPSQYLS